MRLALAAAALPLLAADPPGDARALFQQAAERHFGLQQYEVEVQAGSVSGGLLAPSMRLRIASDAETRSFRIRWLSDRPSEAVSDGDRTWVRTRRGVWDHAAEAPEARTFPRLVLEYGGRFALLGRARLNLEWVKREQVKRGPRRIGCEVIRIRPPEAAGGIWTETLWVEAATGLVWRSVWIDRGCPGAGPAGAAPMALPGGLRGGSPGNAPAGWDVVRTEDYDWLHTEGELPPDTFARPAWAGRAKAR